MLSSFSHHFSSVNGTQITRQNSSKVYEVKVRAVQSAKVAHSPALRPVLCACLPETTNNVNTPFQQLKVNGKQNQFNIVGYDEVPNLTVAIDVDEVLARFLDSLNGYCKDKYGLVYNLSDYDKYVFAKIWGCTSEHAAHIVHEFFTSPHFLHGLHVVPGAQEALQRLNTLADIDLQIVTSRQNVIKEQTENWVNSNFPGIFGDRMHFCNQWSLEGKQRSKSEVCNEIGADVLIDDNPGYAIECAKKGIQVLLFDWRRTYPWAELPPEWQGHELITEVKSWEEVELELLFMVAERSESGYVQQESSI